MSTRTIRTFGLFIMLIGAGTLSVRAQRLPQTFREFLAGNAGREILLVNMSSDSLQFDDADSSMRFVVVLDGVSGDLFTVHRSTPGDSRSFAYPIADIRRITYLWGGRPYKRIVVETF
ncbi:MAG TPA: hypothetical protein VL221_15170 [Bacteroidota bacterium]|nr:hypothetical protein [Bacteroidota bacterium]